MPRPQKPRLVSTIPRYDYFKPHGVPKAQLKDVILTIDQFEAMRLKDIEKLEQHDCAARMGVAQSTLQRILVSAREKVTAAIYEGKALRIEGGVYKLKEDQ